MSVRLSCVGQRIPDNLIQVKDKIESGHAEDVLYMCVQVDYLDAVARLVQALLCREQDAKPRARDVLELAEVDRAGTADGG